jgi:hypothetical protein
MRKKRAIRKALFVAVVLSVLALGVAAPSLVRSLAEPDPGGLLCPTDPGPGGGGGSGGGG